MPKPALSFQTYLGRQEEQERFLGIFICIRTKLFYYGTNVSTQASMSYVRREFLSARWKGDERRSRSVKRSRLGMPKCTPNKYSRRLKRLSLGLTPRHPPL